MIRLLKLFIFFGVLFYCNASYSQNPIIQHKKLVVLDTILRIDSLPLDYNNFNITKNNTKIDESYYSINFFTGIINIDPSFLQDTIIVNYSIFNPNIKLSLRDSSLYIPFIIS